MIVCIRRDMAHSNIENCSYCNHVKKINTENFDQPEYFICVRVYEYIFGQPVNVFTGQTKMFSTLFLKENIPKNGKNRQKTVQ